MIKIKIVKNVNISHNIKKYKIGQIVNCMKKKEFPKHYVVKLNSFDFDVIPMQDAEVIA